MALNRQACVKGLGDNLRQNKKIYYLPVETQFCIFIDKYMVYKIRSTMLLITLVLEKS